MGILVANRGEIACRVMRTCDAMDIETVAVCSEADSGAKHVRAAGESVDLMVVPSEEENTLVLFDPVGGQRSLSQIEWEFKQPLLRAELDGEQLVAQYVDHDYNSFTIQYNGGEYKVKVQSLEEAMLSEHMPEPKVVDTSNAVLSPMPGKVVKVAVAKGDSVVAGQELLVVEAMKMQNVIRSDRNGVIGEVLVGVDSDVAVDQAMVNF